MTSIRSFAEILLTVDDLTTAQRERFVTTIHNESVRLTRLLDDILDLSALEQGERGWENAPVDAEGALEQALMVCEGLARMRGVTLEYGPRAGGAIVLADAGRLSQVFINIISNAISYNDSDDPRVNISSQVADGLYQVAISDNGPGIPEHYQGSIFDKFIRAGPASAPGAHGLGLGLNIAQSIVGKLNGALELTRGVLPGACFRVALPLARATEPAGIDQAGTS